MDIDQFYDADPRRRESDELTYGLNWTSGEDPDQLWDLFWVRDTGELYLMAKPAPPRWLPLIAGSRHPRHHRSKTGEALTETGPAGTAGDEDQDLGVEIIAHHSSQEELERLLTGWEEAVKTRGGIEWLRARVKGATSGQATPAG